MKHSALPAIVLTLFASLLTACSSQSDSAEMPVTSTISSDPTYAASSKEGQFLQAMDADVTALRNQSPESLDPILRDVEPSSWLAIGKDACTRDAEVSRIRHEYHELEELLSSTKDSGDRFRIQKKMTQLHMERIEHDSQSDARYAAIGTELGTSGNLTELDTETVELLRSVNTFSYSHAHSHLCPQ